MARNGFCLKTKQIDFFRKGGEPRQQVGNTGTGIQYVFNTKIDKDSQQHCVVTVAGSAHVAVTLCVTQQQRSFCMSTTSVAFAALLLMLCF